MADDLVTHALAELQDVVRCRCHEAYKSRGLHDPDCQCDSQGSVTMVSDRIEALEARAEAAEAKLAKARDALVLAEQKIVGMMGAICMDVETGKRFANNDHEVAIIRTTMKEIDQ